MASPVESLMTAARRSALLSYADELEEVAAGAVDGDGMDELLAEAIAARAAALALERDA